MFGLIAAEQALKNAKFESSECGVIVGTGVGGMHTLEDEHKKLIKKGQRGVSPFYVPKMIPNIAGGQIAIKYNLLGLNFSMSTACSSATDAIGMAYRLISYNESPEKASRPFDKDRDGFILSEGAGMLMLEEFEEATRRNANIIGEIIGYGITNDAFHITQPDNESIGASNAINMALDSADISKSKVDYINAHGTSTYFNDMLETQAIKKVFGDKANNISISSTKSMTGHLLGAAGAIEAIACINAINSGLIPPTINYNSPDPECDLDYTPNEVVKKDINISMSNSFGFGGHNSVIIFKKFSS